MRIRTLALAAAEWWHADALTDERTPTVTASGYKGRPRESGGRFSLHDGIPGSRGGEGYAR